MRIKSYLLARNTSEGISTSLGNREHHLRYRYILEHLFLVVKLR